MKSISIVNLKGGVGKTVTAVNLAAILATDYGKRVLLVDVDHQGNASRYCGVNTEERGGLAALLTGGAVCYDEVVEMATMPGVDVIPADMSLATLGVDGGYTSQMAVRAMRDLRDAAVEDDSYDFIIFDCPPAFSQASIGAIAASSDVIIPLRIGRFEIGDAHRRCAADDVAQLARPARRRGVHPGDLPGARIPDDDPPHGQGRRGGFRTQGRRGVVADLGSCSRLPRVGRGADGGGVIWQRNLISRN